MLVTANPIVKFNQWLSFSVEISVIGYNAQKLKSKISISLQGYRFHFIKGFPILQLEEQLQDSHGKPNGQQMNRPACSRLAP